MQSEFVTMQEAEKLVRKSRATLVRLCQKVESSGNAYRDENGRWHIKRDALQHFSKAPQSKAKTAKEPENSNLVQWLQSRIEALERQANALLQSNHQLMQENARLKELGAAGQPEKGREGVSTIYVITLIVLGLVAATLAVLILVG